MLKLTKSIINKDRALIGFMVKGKEKEFGGFSNDEIERGVPTDNILQSKFNNNQISVVNNKIIEKSNFKINQLPMTVYTGDGYIDIDNTVNIIGRFVQDNENIGFRVRFSDGSENNFKYINVLTLCNWFKPGNFAIRTSSKGRQYICGKNGLSLDDIPAKVIGKEAEKKPKRMKSAAKDKNVEINGALESGFDVLDIYNFIEECNGCVIKLPSEDYIAASEAGETITDGFTSLGIGEVATPTPIFNSTKLNVNAGFKKVGVVNVNVNGTEVPVTTFVYRSKSIFLNGDNYMKQFGIAVPTEKEDELIAKLGKSLALEKIEDNTVTAPLGQVINAKSLAFYKVDASKIDLISKDRRKESILTAKQLKSLCTKLYELKLISKALGPKGGLMKELKAVLSNDDIADTKGKKIFGAFAMYSKEGLEAVENAGIDIYSGAYTIPGKPYSSGKGSGDTSSQVEIEYSIKGYDINKITGSVILSAVRANDTTKVSENVIKNISKILNETDPKKQYKLADKLYKATEAKVSEINKRFWLHNASMFLEGNKSRIHMHDSKNWVVDSNSRVKTASVYICKAKGCEDLTVKFKGVTI